MDEALHHDRSELKRDLGSVQEGDLHDAPLLGCGGIVALHIVAPDHVEDHVGAVPVRRRLGRGDEILAAVVDGDIGTELLDKVTNNDKAGLIGLCWMDAGARSVYTIKKPVHTIADLKGLKIRVIGNPMFVDMMNALGGNGVAMGYDQVFSALQTGVVDGAENNPPSFVFDNHYQVAKYYTLTEHLIVPEILVLSRKTWDALSAEDRELVRKFAHEAQLEERGLWTTYEQQAIDKAKAAGIQIIEVADKAPFQAAVKPVWEKYGPRFADLIKRIQAVD